MSEAPRKLPIIEVVIFALVVIGALVAWNTRGSRVRSERPPAASAKPEAASGWSAKAAPPQHHRPTLSREAVDRAEKLCLDMVKSQLGWRLKQPVTSAEAVDRYEIGDLETGAGQRLIVEGTAQPSSGGRQSFRCSMVPLTSYYGAPQITFPDLER
ncbi:MAG: hypothetical protein HOQ11_17460 [Gemmatimonadaceae bacterium]|nr:hypothetical protein [Gemmatimonadaceae bacterium]NUQ91620.1 hypothetical protein [Gemmatimonadaceae bacterium]NUR18113.1 hypothetical protein [Gemmatimonadaceae bacterium]NUS99193.1 hypothetical protein [Gemmatimonadaceae bacterium]